MVKYCACGCGTQLKMESSNWAPGHHKRGKDGFKFAESKKSIKPSELGTTGTSIMSGQYSTDIVSDWNDFETRMDRLEKMEKTDSSCRALYSVITLPLRSVKWWVEPASDSAEDKKVADSITWNITEGMTIGFDNILSEILTCVSRGFSLFEKVFETNDAKEFAGSVRWRKWAFRAQRTIDEWDLDKTGGLKRVHQEFNEGVKTVDTWIPIEKLLVFTYGKEGSNFQGDPLFRACWRDYYYKDGLQRIEAIGLERFWLGVPFIKLPKTATGTDKDTAFEIVSEIRGDEAAGVVLPEGWEFGIERVSTEGGTMGEVIERYSRNIFITGLAQFLALGQNDSGSWALSRDQSAFFLYSLNALADFIIADTVNKHAIPQLCKMNWPNLRVFPKLMHEDLEQINLGDFLGNLSKAVSSGFLTSPDVDIEAQVRDMMSLPEAGDDQIEIQNEKIQEKIAVSKATKEAPNVKAEPGKKKEFPPKGKSEGKKLAEQMDPVLIEEGEIALAILDFSNRAPDFAGLLDT